MYHFIINPYSKHGLGTSIWTRLRALLDEKDVRYMAYFISKTASALDLAREITTVHTKMNKVIVIVGRDSNLSEVINGISFSDKIILGFIPIGNKSSFAKSLDISSDPAKALDAILNPGSYQLVDIGTLSCKENEHFFLTGCGTAYMGTASWFTDQSFPIKFIASLKIFKAASSLIHFLKAFLYKPCDAVITIDGGRRLSAKRMLSVSIHNTPFMNGYMFAPKADFADSQFDVCVINNISGFRFLLTLSLSHWGKHTKLKGVRTFRCKSISVETSEPVRVLADNTSLANIKYISAFYSGEKIRFISTR